MLCVENRVTYCLQHDLFCQPCKFLFITCLVLLKYDENFEILWKFWFFFKLSKFYQISRFYQISKFYKIYKFRKFTNFIKFRNFWIFFIFFGNLIGRLEMKSCLWLDNVETQNRPPEAHARKVNSLWGTTRKYCLGQWAKRKIPNHLIK